MASSEAKTTAARPAAKTTTPARPRPPAKSAPAAKSPAPAKARAPGKAVVRTGVAVAAPASENAEKSKKPKMVRDSFTIPKLEYAVLEALKLRGAALTTPVKKTELIRAGIKALAAMQDDAFLAALRAVPNLKTGRPAKNP